MGLWSSWSRKKDLQFALERRESIKNDVARMNEEAYEASRAEFREVSESGGDTSQMAYEMRLNGLILMWDRYVNAMGLPRLTPMPDYFASFMMDGGEPGMMTREVREYAFERNY